MSYLVDGTTRGGEDAAWRDDADQSHHYDAAEFPPKRAVAVLTGMPPDRMTAVVTAMRPKDIARLLLAMTVEQRSRLFGMLPSEHIAAVLLLLSVEQAAAILTSMPEEETLVTFECLPPQAVPMLLAAMSADDQSWLLSAMEPTQASALRGSLYELGVQAALQRTNATVNRPSEAASNVLLVTTSQQSFAVSLFFREFGSLTVQEVRYAQEAAVTAQVRGALAVTNVGLSNEVLAYRRDARAQGWIIDVVTWTDPRQDGLLQRTLAGLIR